LDTVIPLLFLFLIVFLILLILFLLRPSTPLPWSNFVCSLRAFLVFLLSFFFFAFLATAQFASLMTASSGNGTLEARDEARLHVLAFRTR
jgi:hypothetical protein